MQNPEKLAKYLDKVFCHPGNSRKTQITHLGLSQAYQALFNITQYPQGAEKVSGSDGKTTGSAAPPTPATGTAAEPKNQHSVVSVSSVHKIKYWKQKWGHLVRDKKASSKREQEEKVDEADYSKAGPSQEQEEERRTLVREKKEQKLTNEVPTTESLSLSELWKDFRCCLVSR